MSLSFTLNKNKNLAPYVKIKKIHKLIILRFWVKIILMSYIFIWWCIFLCSSIKVESDI